MYPAGVAYNAAAPAAPTDEDFRFLYEQARHFVEARPWERCGSTSFYLDLKVGSWHDVCAQLISNGPARVLFLFPDRRNLLDLQKAKMAEPPAGTIFVELLENDRCAPAFIAEVAELGWPADLRPIPAFQVITPQGWAELERIETRLLALAFAAIEGHVLSGDGAPDAEVAGTIILPGGTRGRYRGRRAPEQEGGLQPFMSVPRFDLYDGVDSTSTLYNLPWPLYQAIRKQALFCREAKQPFEEVGNSIPLAIVSGTDTEMKMVAERLRAADPIGLMLGEMEGAIGIILGGLKESYVLLQVDGSLREGIMLWWHMRKSSGGAYAIVLCDTLPERTSWYPKTVHAIYECRAVED